MKVLVDTPVWSYALRSNNERYRAETEELISLIQNQRATLIGMIRQEILSGYSDLQKFVKLRDKLAPFGNIPIHAADYESAAEFSNRCRRKGIQGSHVDFLICAVAERMDIPIFTTDKDFTYYQNVIPIKLYAYETKP